jgi:hypothetical protein
VFSNFYHLSFKRVRLVWRHGGWNGNVLIVKDPWAIVFLFLFFFPYLSLLFSYSFRTQHRRLPHLVSASAPRVAVLHTSALPSSDPRAITPLGLHPQPPSTWSTLPHPLVLHHRTVQLAGSPRSSLFFWRVWRGQSPYSDLLIPKKGQWQDNKA